MKTFVKALTCSSSQNVPTLLQDLLRRCCLLPKTSFDSIMIPKKCKCFLLLRFRPSLDINSPKLRATTYFFSYIIVTRALGHEFENKLSVRLWQVKNELETKGHYNLTYEELVFGARTAWRNAPRCVNRIVWRQLEVRALI